VTSEKQSARSGDALAQALHVDGPAPDLADQLSTFGQFVGSWAIDWSGRGADGEPAQMRGELHFGWVLGGRAIQDIWIVPARGSEGEGRPPSAFHGTTVRFYDPSIGAWRSTWVEPVNGRVRRFVGRPDGNDIVLMSDEDDPWLRWRFTDIDHRSFRWQAEESHDGGETWNSVEEMLATRSDAGADLRQPDRH
jgi:hypothetical protein